MASSIDVAKAAGVSQSTVSRVFRDLDRVRPATRERVLAAAQALDYRPNEAARNLVTGTTNQIAVIVENLGDPSFTEFIDTAVIELRRRGLRMMLVESDQPDGTLSREAAQSLNAADGVLVASIHLEGAPVEQWLPAGKPAVFVFRRPRELAMPGVFPDHETGVDLAVAHLVALGHERISFIGGNPRVHAYQARSTSFLAALKRRRLPLDERSVVAGAGRYEDGYDITSRLLSGGMETAPTAVFAASDIVAFGALGAAAALGVNVPEGLSVVGFDDLAMAGWASFGLTTIATSNTQMAIDAVSQLDRVMEEGATGAAPTQILVPASLVVRRTTGPARASAV